MSRGVKDLRELICVSRLTLRNSDDEEEDGRLSRAFSVMSTYDKKLSDPDRTVTHAFDSLSLSSNYTSGTDSRESSAASSHTHILGTTNTSIGSHDSGFNTNGISPEADVMLEPRPPVDGGSAGKSKKRKRKKKSGLHILPAMHELPKCAPLPPVSRTNSDLSSRPSSSSSNANEDMESTVIVQKQSSAVCNPELGQFDKMICFMNPAVVADWLTRANVMVNELAEWCNKDENFVQFAYFWLRDFPDVQKKDMLELEYGIIQDEMRLAFSAGRESRKVYQNDISRLIEALFREYPTKMFSSKGAFIFLDYLDILSSERTGEYKRMLSDVKISTQNRQYAQWLLASRSFILVNVWSACVNFYRRLHGNVPTYTAFPLPVKHAVRTDVQQQRAFQSIRNGFVDVLHYLLQSSKITPQFKDDHNKTLVFQAVMQNQLKILQYLLNRVKPYPDVTTAADNGNTPLHAAANCGNVVVVQLLLSTAKVQVNAVNPQCENAAPLHLAVMHGHRQVVELLLENNCDTELLMGTLSPSDIARDFGHTEIEMLFKK